MSTLGDDWRLSAAAFVILAFICWYRTLMHQMVILSLVEAALFLHIATNVLI